MPRPRGSSPASLPIISRTIFAYANDFREIIFRSLPSRREYFLGGHEWPVDVEDATIRL